VDRFVSTINRLVIASDRHHFVFVYHI